jgi:hypothetical protein
VPNDSRKQLGEEVRRHRVAAKLTLVKVSNLLQEQGLEKGYSVTHLSNVENGDVWPASTLIRALEQVLDAEGRLLPLLREAKVPAVRSHEAIGIDLHTFFVGRVETDAPDAIRAAVAGDVHLHVFPFGVAVAHHIETFSVPSLTIVAAHRKRILSLTKSVLESSLAAHADQSHRLIDDTPYGLSLFVLHEPTWSDVRLIARAVHLLAAPTLLLPEWSLVDFTSGAGGTEMEQRLLMSDEPIPDLARFDVAGSHIGAATWSAVSLYVNQRDARILKSLIEFEIQLQALWCYASYVERSIESASRPEDIQFLRTTLGVLAASDPQEHLSLRLMRDALVQTSRIEDVVNRAIARLEAEAKFEREVV